MAYQFGIDFGACNLKCVRVDRSKVRPIKLNTNDRGDYYTPNAIYYKKNQDGTIENVIGSAAIDLGVMEPKNLVIGLKRKLEQKNWRQFIPTLNREVDAQEVTADIFKKIFELATKNVPIGEESRAVVTVPVIFTKYQRHLIKSVAENAGFKVDAVINESFAAIFGVDAENDSLNVIFDVGGSTTDVSIIKFAEDEVQELVATGLKLGGLDIDRDILEKILKPKYGKELAARWQKFANADDLEMDFTRRLKESLYADEFNDSIDATIIDAAFDFELSRAEVDELLESGGYREKIFAMLDELFDELSQGDDCFDKSDVTKIWAMGGSIRIPYFRNLLEEYFGGELFDAENYDFEDNDELIEGLEDKYSIVAGGAANFQRLRENIKAVNAIPYRICYSLGKNLRPGINKNFRKNFNKLILSLKKLEECGWKIFLYQTFSDESDFDSAAYLGEIQLNSAQFEKKEMPILEMEIMSDGRLKLEFFERRLIDGDAQIILVEQHFLNLED